LTEQYGLLWFRMKWNCCFRCGFAWFYWANWIRRSHEVGGNNKY